MTISYEQERQSSFKERVKQEREQEILQAARDVFAERGFEKASIDDIAERVGIGKGTVYLHFSGKEDLLIALMRQACLSLVGVCRAAADQRSAAPDKLRCIIEAIVDHRYANERLVHVVATELPIFLGYKQRLNASSELRALITEVIEQGQAEGVFDARVRPQMAAQSLLFVIFVAPTADGEEALTKQTLMDAACRLHFHGICKESA
jgi:TetR/AcrR family transcriptional regulator, fatty acid metabolism regulator protein